MKKGQLQSVTGMLVFAITIVVGIITFGIFETSAIQTLSGTSSATASVANISANTFAGFNIVSIAPLIFAGAIIIGIVALLGAARN